jgi:hypothetical protein
VPFAIVFLSVPKSAEVLKYDKFVAFVEAFEGVGRYSVFSRALITFQFGNGLIEFCP